MNNSLPSPEGRKPYVAPELELIGDLASLTATPSCNDYPGDPGGSGPFNLPPLAQNDVFGDGFNPR